MAKFSDLPNETLLNIADHLPAGARAKMACVSRRLNAVADDPRAWERMFLRDAGPDAFEVAQAEDKRAWKARYADVHAAVQHPFLTPPSLASTGDYVTVKALAQNDEQDTVCEVVRPTSFGFIKVRPTGPGFSKDTPAVNVLARRCIDGSKPLLVPAPIDCFANYDDLRPGSMGLILDSLPLRTILTTGLRPGVRVKIHRLGVGTSGSIYFMVEEPKGTRTLGELASIYAAEKRAMEAPKGFIAGVLDKVQAPFGARG